MGILYRETKGSALTVKEIDGNFRHLDERLAYIEDGQVLGVEGIARVEQNGNQLTFVGSQGTVFGPFTLPGGLTFRSDWTAPVFYTSGDVVLNNGSSYVCIKAHTSTTFGSDIEAGRWTPLAYRGGDGEAGSRWIIRSGHPTVTNPAGFRAGVDIYVDAMTRTIYERDQATLAWTETLTLGASTAAEIAFDASGTTLTATNVQDALIEIEARLDTGPASLDGGSF